jgi:hypothetical protein
MDYRNKCGNAKIRHNTYPKHIPTTHSPHAEVRALASFEACAANTEREAHPSRHRKWAMHLRVKG